MTSFDRTTAARSRFAIALLLAGLPGMAAAADAPPAVDATIRNAVAACWNRPPDGPAPATTLRLSLRPDGSLAADPVVVAPSPQDPAAKAVAASAIAAVRRCAPFAGLTAFKDSYDQWRDLTLVFGEPGATADDPVAGAGKTYRLTIDGTPASIDPGDTISVTLADGRSVKVSLERNPFATFTGQFFSFDHDSSLAVTKKDLGAGVTQYVLITGTGTTILVQEYRRIDPSTLIQLMLQELTKDARKAGDDIQQQPAQRTLASGQIAQGIKARASSKSDFTSYQIFAVGTSDQGVMLITRMEQVYTAQDGPVLDLFWKTLRLNF